MLAEVWARSLGDYQRRPVRKGPCMCGGCGATRAVPQGLLSPPGWRPGTTAMSPRCPACIPPTMHNGPQKKVRVVHVCDECGAEHALPRKAWPGCVAPGWTKTDRGMLCPDHSP